MSDHAKVDLDANYVCVFMNCEPSTVAVPLVPEISAVLTLKGHSE